MRRKMGIASAVSGVLLAAAAAGLGLARREPGADRAYGTRVDHPHLATARPRVLFDHGHRNSHSISGRYAPFAALIAADGCRIAQTEARLDSGLLRGVDVLVIVNAKGPEDDPTQAAFSDPECDAVQAYVEHGGALLLVADHHPCGEAASKLAARFGVHMSGGWADDSTRARAGSGDPGQIVFTRAGLSLGQHAVVDGFPDSPVDTVESFTGQSLQGPPESTTLLALSSASVDHIPVSSTVEQRGSKRITTFETKDASAAGRSQGLAMLHGRGRVVVLGEAAMLTAQRDGHGTRFGMNAGRNDNRNFTLNTLRWLAESAANTRAPGAGPAGAR